MSITQNNNSIYPRDIWLNSMSAINVYASHKLMILDYTEDGKWIDARRRVNAKDRVKALVQKRILTQQESDNLYSMIDSDDLENLVVVDCILEEKEKIKTWKNKLKFWKK